MTPAQDVEMVDEMLSALETHAKHLASRSDWNQISDPACDDVVGFLLTLTACLCERRDAITQEAVAS